MRLDSDILSCNKCEIGKYVQNKVIIRGSTNPTVLFIGDYPDEDEDRLGVPFCGRGGNIFEYTYIKELEVKEWAVVNLVKCHPFTDIIYYTEDVVKSRTSGNRAPFKEELNNCMPFLFQQIKELAPEKIILMGKTAAKAVLNYNKFGMVNEKYYVLYHPAVILHNPGYKDEMMRQLKECREWLK